MKCDPLRGLNGVIENNRQIEELQKYICFELLYFLNFKCCICMIYLIEVSVYLIYTKVGLLHLSHVIWTLTSGSNVKLTFTTGLFLISFVDAFLRRRLNFYIHKVVANPVSMLDRNIVFRAKYLTGCSGILQLALAFTDNFS